MRSLALCLLLPVACDASPSDPALGSASAPPSASTAPTAAPAGPDLPTPKPHASTRASDLGTLPEGVGIAVGSKAPDFELEDSRGGRHELSALLQKSEVLLFFYRGGW